MTLSSYSADFELFHHIQLQGIAIKMLVVLSNSRQVNFLVKELSHDYCLTNKRQEKKSNLIIIIQICHKVPFHIAHYFLAINR